MSGLTSIRDFKGLHAGRRVFILASGPSLGGLDLTPLHRRLVIGLNRSFLLYPDTQYHCCMDQRLFDQYPEMVTKARFLFTLSGRSAGIQMNLLGSEGFSTDLAEGVYSGYTISYLAMQLAAYMGFSEIIYLGLDLQNDGHNTHFFGQDFCSRNHDSTEFPRMRKMLEVGASRVKELGIRLFNCSPTGILNGFESISFEDAIAR